MQEPNVKGYLDTLQMLGINAKDWLIKAGKSKTIWFSTGLAFFGALESFLPTVQHLLGQHSGLVLTAVGVVTGLLRVATTDAIADK